MKKIALVPDGQFYWKYIESYLDGINADVRTFSQEATSDDLAACGADLLILGTNRIPSVSSLMSSASNESCTSNSLRSAITPTDS